MNPIGKILGTENDCPHCGRKMVLTKDTWATRGYYLTCENKQCSYYKREGGPFLNV